MGDGYTLYRNTDELEDSEFEDESETYGDLGNVLNTPVVKIKDRIDFSNIPSYIQKPINTHEEDAWWLILLFNQNKTGHTRLEKTNNLQQILSNLPIQENKKVWELGLLVDAGSKSDADEIYEMLSCNEQQIRGRLSRSTFLDVICHHNNKRRFGDFTNIINIKNCSKRINKIPLDLIDEDIK